jgi:hypothetical protein
MLEVVDLVCSNILKKSPLKLRKFIDKTKNLVIYINIVETETTKCIPIDINLDMVIYAIVQVILMPQPLKEMHSPFISA